MSRVLTWGQRLTWPDLVGESRTLSLEAGAGDLARIAQALDLEALHALHAHLALRPWLDGAEIEGRLEARAMRICGVTLEPFEEAIDEAIHLRIVPQGSPNAPRVADEVVVDLDAEDPPDEADGPTVDLAAYVVEALALALAPFPRAPGAVFVPPETPEIPSPFAALASLAKPNAKP